MTVGHLAAELGLTLATVSGIVADVERAGFVQRSADPADRRRTIVALAERTPRHWGPGSTGATAPMAKALDKLSPAERAVLLKAMALLDGELNGAQLPDPAPGCSSAQNQSRHGIDTTRAPIAPERMAPIACSRMPKCRVRP